MFCDLLTSLAPQPIQPWLRSVLMPQTESHHSTVNTSPRWHRAAPEGRLSSGRQLQCRRRSRQVIQTQRGAITWVRQRLLEDTHSHILRISALHKTFLLKVQKKQTRVQGKKNIEGHRKKEEHVKIAALFTGSSMLPGQPCCRAEDGAEWWGQQFSTV